MWPIADIRDRCWGFSPTPVGPENLYPLKKLCFETVRSRCSSLIVVMKAANFRQLPDRPHFGWLNRSGLRCIHLQ